MSMESGSCSCDCSDGDAWAISEETQPVARVQHLCGECREPISPGKCYVKLDGLCDDQWIHHKMCMTCHRASQEYFCGCHVLGNLWNELADMLGHEVVDPTGDNEER